MPTLTRDQQLTVNAVARKIQAHYDSVFEPWGFRARAPTMGEPVGDYRRDLAVTAKKLLPEDHELRQRNYRKQPDDVFHNFEAQLLPVVKQYTYDNNSVPVEHEPRMVHCVDSNNGQKFIKWVGLRSFVHDLKAPTRRVVSITTPNGRWDAVKNRWF